VDLPFANLMVSTLTPGLDAEPFTVTTIVSDLPVSRDTIALKPATLLKILGRPEKLYPVTVTVVLRAFQTAPTSLTAFGADEIVTVVATETPFAYGATAALVAVTMQVPAFVTLSALPVMAQPVAVPLVTLKVTAPVPDPPVAANVSGASR
jgi:hypothetical protein